MSFLRVPLLEEARSQGWGRVGGHLTVAGTHTMKVPPPSEQPVTEEEDQAFLTPSSRRKKRSLAARRAALRPWVMSIGLTVLVAVAAVGA